MQQFITKVINRIINKLGIIIGINYGGNTIKQEVKLVSRILKGSHPPPKILIDAGANKGLYTDELLNNFQNVEIHIFEPSLTNIKILNNKFLNNKNVTVNDVGLSKVNETLELYSPTLGGSFGSLSKRRLDFADIYFDKVEMVKVIKFIDYYNNNLKGQTIDFFKLDIEGHEMDALEGCEEVIDNIRCIQFEFGGCNIDTRTYFKDFWYFLNERNFDIYRISPIGLISIDNYYETLETNKVSNYICINRNITKTAN